MKVEFFDSVSYNTENTLHLVVDGSEYFKADKSEEEFCSFQMALRAYTSMTCKIPYSMPRSRYEIIKNEINKSTMLMFTAEVENGLLFIQVDAANNNRMKNLMNFSERMD